MLEVLFLTIAGAVGTISRYGLSGFVQKLSGAGFPYGTLVVNILGSMLIGLIMQIGLNTDLIPRSLRIAITIGFLGAFTTFSTFSYETMKYLEDGAWISAGMNMAANLGLCLLATVAGTLFGRITLGGA